MFLSTIAVENLRRLGGENSSPGGILDPGARWNHRPAQLADEHDPKHPSEIANLLNSTSEANRPKPRRGDGTDA